MQISSNLEQVGTLEFVPRLGNARRTAYGYCIDLPADLLLWVSRSTGDIPIVQNLRAQLSFVDHANAEVEIATIINHGRHEGRAAKEPVTVMFGWSGPITVLSEFERLRNGTSPRFRIRLQGEVAIKLNGPRPGLETMSLPKNFWAQGEVEYPAEQWRNVLKDIRLTDVVMLEIPLDCSAPAGYEEVWRDIAHARDVLLRGGSFAWESCAIAVRRALEAWEKVEPLQMATQRGGGHRSKRERIDALRRELTYYLGYSAHPQGASTSADIERTREDALLGLTMLCALLSVRKP